MGHMTKLPDATPNLTCLNTFRSTKAKKVRGGQKLTWLKQIEREVKPLDFDLVQPIEQTQNRKQ